MKKALFIMLLFSGTAFAQEDTTQQVQEEKFEYNVFNERIHWWQLEKNWKLSPLEIISAVPTFGLDLETKMTPQLSFQYGAAFIPSSFQFLTSNALEEDGFNSMNGYKLRFEARAYVLKKPNRYFSAELSFRHLIINDDFRIGMEGDNNWNFAYFINENRTVNRMSTQLNFKYGINKVCESGFVIDFYTGISLRRNAIIGMQPFEADGVLMPNWNPFSWELSPGHKFSYVTPVVGFKLGFNRPAKSNI